MHIPDWQPSPLLQSESNMHPVVSVPSVVSAHLFPQFPPQSIPSSSPSCLLFTHLHDWSSEHNCSPQSSIPFWLSSIPFPHISLLPELPPIGFTSLLPRSVPCNANNAYAVFLTSLFQLPSLLTLLVK